MTKTPSPVVDKIKELLSDPTKRIALDDFVTEKLRLFIDATSPENFPAQTSNVQQADFVERVKKYDELVSDLRDIVILLARWAGKDQVDLLKKVFKRLSESADKGSAGITLWLHLNWYPIFVLMYSCGISAVASNNYDALKVIFEEQVKVSRYDKTVSLPVWVSSNIFDIVEWFKLMHGYDRQYAPVSEFMYLQTRPALDELLFLGGDYEDSFDRFEIYFALAYSLQSGRGSGPIGRFGWKYRQGDSTNPYTRFLTEASEQKENWPPVKNGLFGGSIESFLKLAEEFGEKITRLAWS